jgi:Phytanoyl-CoA dioxygenase (PhyH)
MNKPPAPMPGAQELLAKAQKTVRRNARRAKRVLNDPRGSVEKYRRRRASVAASRAAQAALPHSVALRENGFTVFRGLIPAAECVRLAATLKAEAGIEESVKYTRVDATNKFAASRRVLFDQRILGAVRSAIGTDGRYLQVSDLHYLHDTFNWHRDSVHRAPDASAAPDWRDSANPFGVVKAILYMESENAAMGIMAGSHLSALDMDHEFVKTVEAKGGQIVIGAADEPNRRFTDAEKRLPLAWKAEVGDVLVFDERMYHAGRRVEQGRVNTNRAAPKFTLSLVFGADNHHSERMYSYFRYARRELHYVDLPEEFRKALADRGLVLSQGWGNFYEREPEELRHVYLRDPAQLEPLIEEFSRAGS